MCVLYISNYLSFGKRQTLTIGTPQTSIVGYINSGKTNIVKTFSLLLRILRGHNLNFTKDESNISIDNEISEICLTFSHDNCWFRYSVSFISSLNTIVSEDLCIGTEKIFERNPLGCTLVNSFKGKSLEKNNIFSDITPAKSCIPELLKNSEIDSLSFFSNFISNFFIVGEPLEDTEDVCTEDSYITKKLAQLIEHSFESVEYPEDDEEDIEPLVVHTGNIKIPLSSSSSGLRKLLHFAPYFIRALHSGGTLLIDNFETSYHVLLAKELISIFNDVNLMNRYGNIPKIVIFGNNPDICCTQSSTLLLKKAEDTTIVLPFDDKDYNFNNVVKITKLLSI